MNRVLTLEEAADFLRVHKTSMYRIIRRKQIPSFKVGSSHRFSLDALVEWVNAESAAWVAKKRERLKENA